MEILLTISIVVILVALSLPMLARSKAKAQNTKCQSNLRQLFLVITAYADDHQSAVPFTRYHIERHPGILACPSDVLFSQRTNPPVNPPSSYRFNTVWRLNQLLPNGSLAVELFPWHDPQAVVPEGDRPSGHYNQLHASGEVSQVFLGDGSGQNDLQTWSVCRPAVEPPAKLGLTRWWRSWLWPGLTPYL
jgi:type II secretory pathway pseudopilin PulG